MTDFLSALYSSPHWVFIALGCLLLIAELLGTGGYTLWSGIAAILVGIMSWTMALSWPLLWILFAIFTLISAYLWWLWLKKNWKDKAEKGLLNQPQKELIGIETVVVNPIIHGIGRVKIKDGSWSARCDEDLPVGTPVRVVDVNGLVVSVIKLA